MDMQVKGGKELVRQDVHAASYVIVSLTTSKWAAAADDDCVSAC